MSGSLSSTQLEQYRNDGFIAPVDGFDSEECRAIRRDIEGFGRRHGVKEAHILRNKAHLKMPGLLPVVRDPRILDAVESVLGPDILCWGSSFFIKEPGGGELVGWHQDSYYWDMTPEDVCVVWMAIEPSTLANGAMQVIPGSHAQPLKKHGASPEGSHNMLFTYEEIREQIDEDEAVACLLEPGQFSIHHMSIIHGSGPNRSDDRRVGFSITYLAPHVVHGGKRNSAMLVRGEDRYGNFVADPIPRVEMQPDVLAFIEAPYGGSSTPVSLRTSRPDQDFYRKKAS